jgi:HD-like signal output (HDOD) protein
MTSENPESGPTVESELERVLKDIGIPPRPIILDRISEEVRKEEPSFIYLGQLISADVGLAASLVKMANSPYFGLHSRARSVNDAMLMLGLNVTSRAIAGLSLRKAFQSTAPMERFWSASAQIAVLSGWLAHILEKPRLRPDESYTYGLFRDCGIPVLLRRFPTYEQTLARANDELELPFTQIELNDFPADHTTVGCLLAQNWWLPEEICLAIRHHHDLHTFDLLQSSLPTASRYMMAVAHTAEYLLQLNTGLSHTCEWTKHGGACLRLLDITQAELPALCEEAAEVLKSVAS